LVTRQPRGDLRLWGYGLEIYTYDAFGTPTITDGAGNQRSTSAYGNRFMFTGREYLLTFGIYDYRNRFYHPGMGIFIQTDPKGFDAGDMNLFRYCGDDPVDKSDPMGLYAMGAGWDPERWRVFDQAQKAAAQQLSNTTSKLDKALEAGKESKAFEKIFGKGKGTAENMAKVSEMMKGMVTALRDDGSKGYVANAITKDFVAEKGWPEGTMGRGTIDGKTIQINVDHPLFGKQSALSWTAGHESGHNAGLGRTVDVYRWDRENYQRLAPEQRLDNADSYMDFSRHQ
jgi:RHS repeat-associated protein